MWEVRIADNIGEF